jgi:hypothetical protein
MYLKLASIVIFSVFFTGCASVPLERKDISDKAKTFQAPTNGNAGLYIFRTHGLGASVKKNIWIDDVCIGQTAPNIFFYQEVKGDKEHTISTESEFSPNHLVLKTESGKIYFIEQYMKMGVFVGGSDLELVDANEGKKAVLDMNLAQKGFCKLE